MRVSPSDLTSFSSLSSFTSPRKVLTPWIKILRLPWIKVLRHFRAKCDHQRLKAGFGSARCCTLQDSRETSKLEA